MAEFKDNILLDVQAVQKQLDSMSLQSISFQLNAGQRLAIIGESGSGKSSLLKMIGGLASADSGQVLFQGKRVKGPEEVLLPGHPGIAYLSQHFELRNNYRMEELLEYGNKLNPAMMQELIELLVEEYIDGREFTVLVAANPDGKTCRVFKPVEYVFPEGRAFKTYALKTSELHPDCNHPCSDPVTEAALREAAAAIFKGFSGVGYARLDFRQKPDGSLYFLEINFTCSVFYTDGYEGSADFILQFDGIGQQGFLQHIIAEGMARHQRKQPLYEMKGNAIAGYGIYAARPISKGEVVFKGEGRAQRIITKPYVDKNWTDAEKQVFAHYAYPVSGQVYILWDDDPTQWAP